MHYTLDYISGASVHLSNTATYYSSYHISYELLQDMSPYGWLGCHIQASFFVSSGVFGSQKCRLNYFTPAVFMIYRFCFLNVKLLVVCDMSEVRIKICPAEILGAAWDSLLLLKWRPVANRKLGSVIMQRQCWGCTDPTDTLLVVCYSGCNYLSMLGLKFNHVSKRRHSYCQDNFYWQYENHNSAVLLKGLVSPSWCSTPKSPITG